MNGVLKNCPVQRGLFHVISLLKVSLILNCYHYVILINEQIEINMAKYGPPLNPNYPPWLLFRKAFNDGDYKKAYKLFDGAPKHVNESIYKLVSTAYNKGHFEMLKLLLIKLHIAPGSPRFIRSTEIPSSLWYETSFKKLLMTKIESNDLNKMKCAVLLYLRGFIPNNSAENGLYQSWLSFKKNEDRLSPHYRGHTGASVSTLQQLCVFAVDMHNVEKILPDNFFKSPAIINELIDRFFSYHGENDKEVPTIAASSSL